MLYITIEGRSGIKVVGIREEYDFPMVGSADRLVPREKTRQCVLERAIVQTTFTVG